MLGCDDVYREASDALDGEVSAWRRMQIRMHLAFCARCRAMQRSLERTVALLRRLGRAG